MLFRSAGLRLSLDLEAIPRPDGVAERAWLTCFPSFGFLLAVNPGQAEALAIRLKNEADLLARPIGRFEAKDTAVVLERHGQRCPLWQGQQPLTGFGPLVEPQR